MNCVFFYWMTSRTSLLMKFTDFIFMLTLLIEIFPIGPETILDLTGLCAKCGQDQMKNSMRFVWWRSRACRSASKLRVRIYSVLSALLWFSLSIQSESIWWWESDTAWYSIHQIESREKSRWNWLWFSILNLPWLLLYLCLVIQWNLASKS